MSKTFFLVEGYSSGTWRIDFLFENFELKGNAISFYFTSSYHVPAARLLGLSYPDYLRFCCQNGAFLRGKKGYTHPVWNDKAKCQEICNLINKEWDKVAKEF